MYTAPAVRQARNDMMAITTVRALPAIEADGTICAVFDWNSGRQDAGGKIAPRVVANVRR